MLTKVKNLEGRSVWINPNHIIMAKLFNDYARVYLTGEESIDLSHDVWAHIDMTYTDTNSPSPVPQTMNLIAENRDWYHSLWNLFIAYEATLAGDEHEDAAKAIDEHLRAFPLTQGPRQAAIAPTPTPQSDDEKNGEFIPFWMATHAVEDIMRSPEMQTLIRTGKRIDAIRLYRQSRNHFHEAKLIVELAMQFAALPQDGAQ